MRHVSVATTLGMFKIAKLLNLNLKEEHGAAKRISAAAVSINEGDRVRTRSGTEGR
jgi:hypothetical protein